VLLGGNGSYSGYVNIDDLGLYDLTNHAMLYVYWRNWHGRLIGGHISGCWDPWHEDGISALRRYNILGTGSAGLLAPAGSGRPGGGLQSGTPAYCMLVPATQLALTNINGDGYDDGFTTFQGARTFDSGLNQWTTPDAYAGDVHDPASQQPYMWNRNDPYVYSDPSGYEWTYIDPSFAGAISKLSASKTFRDAFEIVAKSRIPVSMKGVPNNNSDVVHTVAPGRETGGEAATEPSTDTKGNLTGIKILIGLPNSGTEVLRSVAGEVFNSSRMVTDYKSVVRDFYTPDPKFGNAAEAKGAAGTDQIMKETKLQ
jgi:hypothetical protein